MTDRSIAQVARDLADGSTSSLALTEACLAAIDAPEGEGARAFIEVDRDHALTQARAFDALRTRGVPLPRYAGIPFAIKDLFDIAGQQTRAGSTALSDAAPALTDAEAVSRLRRAGFVLIGRTNMSEFAFSGVGINPHYGTPASIWDRGTRRVPGGSSSGSAIAVSDGMALAALGTDTGGSCRIPAALNGLVGFKPTARRVSQIGTVPLSASLDSVGPIASTVSCCAAIDAILAGEPEAEEHFSGPSGLRFAVPDNYLLNGVDEHVAFGFARALTRLSEAGALIRHIEIPELDTIPHINALGGLPAAESYAWHRDLIARKGETYDPRVRIRIERGAKQSAADYIDLIAARKRFITAVERRLAPFDALLMPTVPIVPPRIKDLEDDDAFAATNMLLLRNPSVINLLDGCAISIPVHDVGSAPVGLTLAGVAGLDRKLLGLAAVVSRLF